MHYCVLIVPDHALPADVKRVVVERRDDLPALVLAESAAENWRFVQSWERLCDTTDAYGGVMLQAV